MVMPNVYQLSEAAKIVKELTDLILDYGVISVADAYDCVGLSTPTYEDSKIGWSARDISSITCHIVEDGCIIDLPEPHALDMLF